MTNLSLGLILSGLLVKFSGWQALLLTSATLLLGLILTAIIWSLMSSKDGYPKKAIDELEEGEVHWVLCQTSGIEGNLALVRSKKTKELKLLVFKEVPPTIFKKEKGKIVDATQP